MFQYLPVNPSLIYGWKTHEATFPSSFADSSIILNPHNTSSSFHLQPHSHHHHITNLDDIALVHAQNPHYHHHHHHQASTVTDDPTAAIEDEEEETKMKKKKKASDRHSKIAVKNRLRHRRTRLSIEVARQLFDLQDMLRVERASKAVEWLLRLARPEITKLRRERYPGLNSEGEAVGDSGLDVEPAEQSQKTSSTGKNKKKEYRRSRSSSSLSSRSTYSAATAKAAREMARKRARDRTLFKRSRMTTGTN